MVNLVNEKPQLPLTPSLTTEELSRNQNDMVTQLQKVLFEYGFAINDNLNLTNTITDFVKTIFDDEDGETVMDTITAQASAATPLLDVTEDFFVSFKNGDITGNTIYGAIFPSVQQYDAVQGIVDVVDTSDANIEGANGIGGYVRLGDKDINGVCLFGCGQAIVNDANIWGLNTLLMDASTRTSASDTGRQLIGYEADFNVMNPATTLIGASFGGNSLAQPATASGVLISKLHASNGARWTTGFSVQDDACSDFGLNLGTAGDPEGSQISSCKLNFSGTDNNATPSLRKTNLTFQVIGFSTPFLQLTGGPLKLSNQPLWMDTGTGIVINGSTVLTDRQTGYTNAMTGSADRATSYATSTITLEQLAERVKALQDDLTTHGIIGV